MNEYHIVRTQLNDEEKQINPLIWLWEWISLSLLDKLLNANYQSYLNGTSDPIVMILIHLTRGGFHKPIYTPRQALTLSVKHLRPKKASQKLGAEGKLAFRPTFSLYEIDPR